MAARSSVRIEDNAPPYLPIGVRIASHRKTVFMSFSKRALSRARTRLRHGSMRQVCAPFEIAQGVKFDACWRSGFFELRRETDFPTGCTHHLLAGDAWMQLRD